MPDPVISWPHAPIHQLSETGTYLVTAGTYLKAHYFRTRDRLDVLHRGLLALLKSSRMEKGSKLGWPQFVNVVGQAQQESLFALSR